MAIGEARLTDNKQLKNDINACPCTFLRYTTHFLANTFNYSVTPIYRKNANRVSFYSNLETQQKLANHEKTLQLVQTRKEKNRRKFVHAEKRSWKRIPWS